MAVSLLQLIDIYGEIARDKSLDAKDRLAAADRIRELRRELAEKRVKPHREHTEATEKSGNLLGKAAS